VCWLVKRPAPKLVLINAAAALVAADRAPDLAAGLELAAKSLIPALRC